MKRKIDSNTRLLRTNKINRFQNISVQKLSKVTRAQNKQEYIVAQYLLGLYYSEIKHDYEKSINYLLNIIKEDCPLFYTVANYTLGTIYYYKIHNYVKAEHYLLKIYREEDPELYAKAQVILGRYFCEKRNNYDRAKEFLLKISKEDCPENFAVAQCYLGCMIYDLGNNYQDAEYYFTNVSRKDNPEFYALAQYHLGRIYDEIKYNSDKAINYFSKIFREDNPRKYNQAQFHLGSIYYENKEDDNKALRAWLNIGKKHSHPLLYLAAQLNIGVIYKRKKQYDKAIEVLSNITKKEYHEVYPRAQYLLGSIYQENKHDDDMAIKFFSNVSYEHDSEFYYLAQFEIGNIYLFNKNLPAESCKYYNEIKYCKLGANNYISAQIILELINQKSCSISKIKDEKELLINNIEKICQLTQEIKNSLMVSLEKESLSNEETVTKNPERRVAHYTKPSVLFNLLKGKKPSKFRLNIVDFMNDPSENQVLTQWLNITTNPDNDIKTFLASFSFNHNSLNQFRLYGNEENILGSGVSIAFNQKFFGQNAESSINMENINLTKNFSAVISENENSISSQVKIENELDANLHPLSIYRCLYFDPKTEYISLAKRNKQSFYLEMYHEKKDTEEIDQEWQKYIEALKEEHKIETIRQQLGEIKDLMQAFLDNEEFKTLPSLEQLLSLAVLPISCLIKHAAFEDEDECRMIYITHIADKNIVEPTDYQGANNLYIEYTEVEDYIDRIYLGPQCKMQHKLWLQNHFKKKQTEKEIKLIKSEMPLR